ncbi:Multiprotein-bridging factor 1 [Verticillium dahliae VDG1]|nr:Multiprotein-bridging factor 1 [Verticillium dahliae VDG1]
MPEADGNGYPAYSVPEAKPLTSQETRSVSAFLLLRHQIHDGPLYTTRKLYTAADSAFSSSHKHYGQAQLNAKYAAGGGGARTKANQDPFTADEWDEEAGGEDATKRRLEALSRMGREPEGEEAEMGEDDEAEEEEQDEEYDDEDAGDYNAEEYFENGDDMDDDGGDDDQGGDAY